MKIAYLGQMADVSRETSIAKKIRSQAAAWMAAGHTVKYFSLCPDTSVWAGMAPVRCEIVSRRSLGRRPVQSRLLAQRIRDWAPDVIYFRYAYHSAGFPALFADIPAVAEINSDDQTEYRHTLAWWKRLYHGLTRRRILGACAGFVCVTHELAERFSPLGRPVEVIGNSIDLAGHRLLAPAPAGGPRRLAFMGSPATPWHGLDRLGELCRMFPDWQFDLIGCTESDWWQVNSAERRPPANLRFHGHLGRTAYEPLLAGATAAIGTLGLYRKSMDEACPLKVREYLALGLCVIGACHDPDIPAAAEHYLRLPNSAAPLAPQRAAINAFVDRWTGQRVPRTTVAHLDTTVKEAARLAFMEKIVAGFRRTAS
jgi:hypothetical protein